MKLVITNRNIAWLEAVFLFWLMSEVLFEYSVISRLALVAFVGVTLLITRRATWSGGLTAYALFILWSVLNIHAGYAVSRSTATAMTTTLALNLVFLYAFVCFCRYLGDMNLVLGLFKGVAMVFCIICLVGGFESVLLGQRLSIFGLNANIIARMAAAAIVIDGSAMLHSPRQRTPGRLLGVVLMLLTLLMTGSRKGLIFTAVGLYVCVCFRRPGRFVFYSLGVLALGALGIVLCLRVPALYSVIGYRIQPVLLMLRGEEFTEASLNSRVDFMALAWASSQDSLLWGHGLDCFRLLRRAYGTYSHCNYVELLYSLGWPGVLLYYSGCAGALLRTGGAWKRERELTGLMAALLIAFLVCDYTAVTYFSREMLIIPMMAMLHMGAQPGKKEAVRHGS